MTEIQKLADTHVAENGHCRHCYDRWPCMTSVLVAAILALDDRVSNHMEGHQD